MLCMVENFTEAFPERSLKGMIDELWDLGRSARERDFISISTEFA